MCCLTVATIKISNIEWATDTCLFHSQTRETANRENQGKYSIKLVWLKVVVDTVLVFSHLKCPLCFPTLLSPFTLIERDALKFVQWILVHVRYSWPIALFSCPNRLFKKNVKVIQWRNVEKRAIVDLETK